MPLYRYKPKAAPCRMCGLGFDYAQPAGQPDLRECPTCGKEVSRDAVSIISTPKATRKPSVSEAKQAGFTVLKRTSGGEYEKQ